MNIAAKIKQIINIKFVNNILIFFKKPAHKHDLALKHRNSWECDL